MKQSRRSVVLNVLGLIIVLIALGIFFATCLGLISANDCYTVNNPPLMPHQVCSQHPHVVPES